MIKIKGKVKFFNTTRGFGFIIGEDAEEYFFHLSEVKNREYLEPEQKVSFDIEETDKGVKAVNVKSI